MGGYPSDYLRSHNMKELRFDHMMTLQLLKNEALGNIEEIKNPATTEKHAIQRIQKYIDHLDSEITNHG